MTSTTVFPTNEPMHSQKAATAHDRDEFEEARSVPDRNLHVLRLAELRLLLSFLSTQPFLCAVRPQQLRKPSWSRDQLRPS